jgi:Helix-turn-helix domain
VTPNLWHWIVDEPNLSGHEKWVAVVVQRHANGEGWAWPSPERISRLSGLSRRTVYYALSSLEAKNVLEKNTEKTYPRYRIVQRQGLLFSTANTLLENCENVRKTVETSAPPALHSAPGAREVRTSLLKTEKNTRAQPARGGNLWKLHAKRERIKREIQTICEVYAGAHGDDVVRRDYKLRLLYAELEKTGWQDARAG